MTKLFAKILSLVLALLMLAGCSSAKDPLEGTMEIKEFNVEELAMNPNFSQYTLSGDMLENCFFGQECRMFECAIFGKILNAKLVIAKPAERKSKHVPEQLCFVRYEVQVEEVIQNVISTSKNDLQVGNTITLYHPYEEKTNSEGTFPNAMEVGKTYALTFMEGYECRFFYSKDIFLVDKQSKYREHVADDVATLWKVPLKDIGDYYFRWVDYHAYEVEGDEVHINTWTREIADHYFEGTPYEKDVDHRYTWPLGSYRVSKEFFRRFAEQAYKDSQPWSIGEGQAFRWLYLAKYDPQEYEKLMEGVKERSEETRKMLEDFRNSNKQGEPQS